MLQKRMHTVDCCFLAGSGAFASFFRLSPALVSKPNLTSAALSVKAANITRRESAQYSGETFAFRSTQAAAAQQCVTFSDRESF